MTARLVLPVSAALCALALGSTALAAAPARSDREVLRDAAFARAPRARDEAPDAGRFATWRPDPVEPRGRDRTETERARSDLKAMSPGGATAGFRVKF